MPYYSRVSEGLSPHAILLTFLRLQQRHDPTTMRWIRTCAERTLGRRLSAPYQTLRTEHLRNLWNSDMNTALESTLDASDERKVMSYVFCLDSERRHSCRILYRRVQ